MKKNVNVNKYSNKNSQIALPEVKNMDLLSYASDDELERLHTHLQEELEKASRFSDDVTPWEIEICYVQREMRIRSSRKAAHDRYLKSNPDFYADNYATFD